MPLTIIDHPIAADCLARIRDTATSTHHFREQLERLSFFLAIEATRKLSTIELPVTTPLATCMQQRLHAAPILAPVLRAGLGLVDGFLQILPDATIAHLGFYRDTHTLAAVPYYANIPDRLANRPVFVLDPMLATGHSAEAAIKLLQKHGAENLTLVTVLVAQLGLTAIMETFPHLHIVSAAIDPELNDHGYIVPGLGDAGDRQFGTDHSAPDPTASQRGIDAPGLG